MIYVRTVCVRPNITGISLSTEDTPTVRGIVSIPSEPQEVISNSQVKRQQPRAFACQTSPGLGKYRETDWNITICNLNGTGLDSVGRIMPYFEGSESSPLPATRSFLVINASGDIHSLSKPGISGSRRVDYEFNRSREWLQVSKSVEASADSNSKLSFSLCLPSFVSWAFNISAASREPLKEPTYAYNITSEEVSLEARSKSLGKHRRAWSDAARVTLVVKRVQRHKFRIFGR